MNTIRLALRMLSRDARAGELSVLIAALVLAAASVGTVGFFADRVKGALTRQANLLLGADLMVSADRPLPSDYTREAATRGLATVPVIRFNSMVQPPGGGDAVLADVKAVGATYPLRGAVMLAVPDVAEGRPATGAPGRGEAWKPGWIRGLLPASRSLRARSSRSARARSRWRPSFSRTPKSRGA
ncbi:MAG: hypothetical protein E6H53_13900 [Betaproteobacteria bacterium]|nr:MAG: hypothetical protein E6H53_13900 [Betaproteobacteria bacterium]